MIVNELGLVGACGLLLVYLLFAERGFKIAMLARDSFSKLLAAGLTAVFALQVFVIVGGVTRVIPLTGVTLPFVSYGGSSIVANFVLLALLLLVSDRARPAGAGGRDERADRPPLRPRRRAVRRARRRRRRAGRCSTRSAARQPARELARGAADQARAIRAADGTVLARSVKAQGDTYTRATRRTSSPTRSATRSRPRARRPRGLPQRLTGRSGAVDSLLDKLSGRKNGRRWSPTSTQAQQAAIHRLAGRKGAVVALEPATGKVLVMASVPGFDQNQVPKHFKQLTGTRTRRC